LRAQRSNLPLGRLRLLRRCAPRNDIRRFEIVPHKAGERISAGTRERRMEDWRNLTCVEAAILGASDEPRPARRRGRRGSQRSENCGRKNRLTPRPLRPPRLDDLSVSRKRESMNSRRDAKTQGIKGNEGIGDSGRVGSAHRLWFTTETLRPPREPRACSSDEHHPVGCEIGMAARNEKGPKGGDPHSRRASLRLFTPSFVFWGCAPENMPDLVLSGLRNHPRRGSP